MIQAQQPTPREILEQMIRDNPALAPSINTNAVEDYLPDMKFLANLREPLTAHDPNELLQHRFLCRGGAGLLVGPTGIGKSSLTMQASICWAAGLPFFGIQPARPLRIMIIQAENDEGDMAEMRNGVLRGMNLTHDQRQLALHNIIIVNENTKTREQFAALLDSMLQDDPQDLIIVDPAFAYIGGDASSQRDVSPFLRNMLNPVIQRHKVGLLLVHHSNKPPSGDQKASWQAGDFAYLGAGSAEFANWARAVIAIRSIGSDSVFQLLLAKRGRRARWTDEAGNPTVSKHIAYHTEPGTICWRELSTAESLAILGRSKPTPQDVVDILQGKEMWLNDLVTKIKENTGLKDRAARDLVEAARISKCLTIEKNKGPNNAALVTPTKKLKPRPPIHDSGENEPPAFDATP